MTQTWLIFKIGKQNVYQIQYKIHIGQDSIDEYKEILAKKHKVSELDIMINFEDKPVIADVVSFELKNKTIEVLNTIEIKN